MSFRKRRRVVLLVAGLVVICAGLFEAGLAIGHGMSIPAAVSAVLFLAGIAVVTDELKGCPNSLLKKSA